MPTGFSNTNFTRQDFAREACHTTHTPSISSPLPPQPRPRLLRLVTVPQAWPDRREPPALRAAARLSNGGQESRDTPSVGDDIDDLVGSCDVRLLFVSGAGLNANARRGSRDMPAGAGNDGYSVSGGGDEDDSGDDGAPQGAGRRSASTASTMDMWGVLGRELWRPWPQADVVVHTGSQVSCSGEHRRFEGCDA